MMFLYRPEVGTNAVVSRTKRRDNVSVLDQGTKAPIG